MGVLGPFNEQALLLSQQACDAGKNHCRYEANQQMLNPFWMAKDNHDHTEYDESDGLQNQDKLQHVTPPNLI